MNNELNQKQDIALLCHCGCNQETKKNNRFIFNHHRKGNKASDKTKKKMKDNWRERKQNGFISPLKGRHISETHSKNISKAIKGKSYEERFGEEKAKELKELRRQQMIENNPTKNPETVKKMIEKLKNRKCSDETRKKHSERMKNNNVSKRPEVSSKISKTLTDWDFYNQHGTFKHLYPYPPEFKKLLKTQIADRDNHTCQECKNIENGHRFSTHHIDYDKDNIHQKNLILLCKTCHGKTNYNKIYWKPHFESYQQQRGIL